MMSGSFLSVKKKKAKIQHPLGRLILLIEVYLKNSMRKSQCSKPVRKVASLLPSKDHRFPIAKGARGWVAFGFVTIGKVRDKREALFIRTRVYAPIKLV